MEITTNRPDKLLPEVLKDALFGKQAHVSLERALDGLQWHQAGVEVPQYPHTIWQQLKHLNYWQDRFISRLEGMTVLPAKSSDEGWCFTKAPMDENEFRREVGKLLTGINYTAETILSDPAELSQQKGDYPHGFGVVQAMASHLSYHIGEIVLLRRMMGIWPPPSGGYSW
ncbi:MAG: DinB family protein [Cyclobacteriaceae bacterium]|nr:DinB family protein [Cyclobacteriaceae bacterium]